MNLQDWMKLNLPGIVYVPAVLVLLVLSILAWAVLPKRIWNRWMTWDGNYQP